MLAIYVQHLAAGDERMQVGSTLEEVKHPLPSRHYLLEVVEYQEQVLIAQSGAKALEERLA
jgi:hypothetical protein